MGQPWTNKHMFLAIAITRFCNFHFVNILYWVPVVLYLRYTSGIFDFGQMFRFARYKYRNLAKEEGYIFLWQPELLTTRINRMNNLMFPNLITSDFFYCRVVRIHLFSISYYHRRANIFINKSKGLTIYLWKNVMISFLHMGRNN